MTHSLMSTSGERAQPDPLLNEYRQIANKAIGESGMLQHRNDTRHIREALILLRDPRFNGVKDLRSAKNTRQILEGISDATTQEVNGLSDEQVVCEIRILRKQPTVADLTPGQARIALDALRNESPPTQPEPAQGWLQWVVEMVVSAGNYVAGSAADLLENAKNWTPAYRQAVIADLEEKAAAEEKKV